MLNTLINGEDISEQVASEHAAYYGATELLIPTEIVPLLYAEKKELEADPEFALTANLEIAKKLGVPENVIEFRLDDSVNDLFNQIQAS